MDFAKENSRRQSISPSLKVAVTGGACSGKTSVCNRLKELGAKVISSDVLAREAVSPGSPAYKNIVNYFGKRVLENDGALNRRMLRRIIISDEVARRYLERFVHSEIIHIMELQIAKAENAGSPVVVVEVPLLFELGMEDLFDVVVVVSADYELEVKRLMDRDGVSRDDAKALLNIQMSDKEKVKRAEFVIKNDGSIEHLIRSVDSVYEKFFQKYAKRIKST